MFILFMKSTSRLCCPLSIEAYWSADWKLQIVFSLDWKASWKIISFDKDWNITSSATVTVEVVVSVNYKPCSFVHQQRSVFQGKQHCKLGTFRSVNARHRRHSGFDYCFDQTDGCCSSNTTHFNGNNHYHALSTRWSRDFQSTVPVVLSSSMKQRLKSSFRLGIARLYERCGEISTVYLLYWNIMWYEQAEK